MKKGFKITLWILCGIGLCFFVLGSAFGLYSSHVKARCITVEGTIVSTDGRSPLIRYDANGTEQLYHGGISTTSQRVGDAYTLYYDPETGEIVADTVFEILSWVFGGIGLGTLLAGLVVYLCAIHAARKRDELLSYGTRVTARTESVAQNPYISVNNRHPWVVKAVCVHPVTGQTVTVRSQSLWEMPALTVGDSVDVLFDPINEKKYAMDVTDRL